MKFWVITGLGGALVCCGGESIVREGEEAGGTGGVTGGASGTATGGTGSTSEAPASTGVGAGGGFPLSNFQNGCDIGATFARNCALSGCHKQGAIQAASGLVLTPDDWLVPRIRDVPAQHSDIYCGTVPCETIPAECPVGVSLADTTDWESSWLYRKITDPAGCGDLMPPSVTFTPEDRACIVAFVQDIARFW